MTIANLKPMFIINDEALSDLDELSTHTEHGKAKGIHWLRFVINGVPLVAFEWGPGSGRYTLTEADDGRNQMIEADADMIIRHIERGFPRVSGSFPSVVINTGAVPAAKANDDKPATTSSTYQIGDGDEDIDAMLAELGGVDEMPTVRSSTVRSATDDSDIDAMMAELD